MSEITNTIQLPFDYISSDAFHTAVLSVVTSEVTYLVLWQ